MPFTTAVLLTIINIVQTGTGLTLNTCIAYFSFKSLKEQPGANLTSAIYFTMGLVNIVIQLTNTAQNLIFSFWSELVSKREISAIFTFLMFFLFCCNYWLTGLLCMYYCININHFTHRLLIGFKRVLTSFLPQILLVSSVGSLGLGVWSIWIVNVEFVMQTSTNITQDSSAYTATFDMPLEYRLIASILGCCLPFSLAFISTGITALSLLKHMRRMKGNISEHSSANLQGLASATRTMVLFLILCIIFYIAEFMIFSTTRSSSTDIGTFLTWLIITCFPLAEGAIIIQGIPKLRRMILEMFCAKRQVNNVIK